MATQDTGPAGKDEGPKRDDVKAAFERLRASVRSSARGGDAIRLLQVIDVLEQNFMAGRYQGLDVAKADLQIVRGTARRLLRETPDSMVRMLKAIDGLEDDVLRFLDSLARKQAGK